MNQVVPEAHADDTVETKFLKESVDKIIADFEKGVDPNDWENVTEEFVKEPEIEEG